MTNKQGADRKISRVVKATLALAAMVPAQLALALVPMEETELSSVSGMDGIALNMNAGATPSIREAVLRTDTGTANEAALLVQNLTTNFTGGASLTLDVGASAAAGATGMPFAGIGIDWTNANFRIGALGHSYYRDNAPLVAGQPDRTVDRSFGIVGIRNATGNLSFVNGNGLLNTSASNFSRFNLSTVADIYYRQSTGTGAPELSFGNLNLGFRFTDGAGNPGPGSFGATANGLEMRAPFMDFDLNFDVFVSPTTASEFQAAARKPTILFGWQGGIKDAVITLGGGGFGYGTFADLALHPTATFFNHSGQYATRSEGLNVTTQWNYGPNFRWILGQAAGNRIRVDFFDWRRLGAGTAGEAAYDFRMPIVMDAINAAEGPGGICFGGDIPTSGSPSQASCTATGAGNINGSFINVAPDNNNIAVAIRDGRLHAYNSQVRLNDVDAFNNPVIDRFDWSLFYTYGKLDANIYLYPDGIWDAVTSQYGGKLHADVAVAIQSPGYWYAAQSNFAGYAANFTNPAYRWATNTHFLIADTDINNEAPGNSPTPAQIAARDAFGIGLLNADLLWRVDDLFITLVGSVAAPTADPNSSNYYQSNATFPGMWLQTSNLAKFQFRGLFGGGNLADLTNPVRISLLDVNLETNNFIFVLGPPRTPGAQYVAFDALLSFNSAAYISLAEPSSPTASVSFKNVQGTINWVNGRVELESSQTTGGRPRLTIANDLLVGSTATAFSAASALQGDVFFGSNRLGSVVVPTGMIRSSVSLQPQ